MSTGVNDDNRRDIISAYGEAGVSSSNEMVGISRDFDTAPIDLSEMIKRDFEMKGLLANQLRTALMVMMARPVLGGRATHCFFVLVLLISWPGHAAQHPL